MRGETILGDPGLRELEQQDKCGEVRTEGQPQPDKV
jgi:hypothetical protein